MQLHHISMIHRLAKKFEWNDGSPLHVSLSVYTFATLRQAVRSASLSYPSNHHHDQDWVPFQELYLRAHGTKLPPSMKQLQRLIQGVPPPPPAPTPSLYGCVCMIH